VFWSAFEPGVSAATARGLGSCPPGHEMHGGAGAGFHRFHCYDTAQLRQFDLIFQLDRQIGAQGAAILYAAPPWAREPNCTGFVFGKDAIKGGCVPRDDAMDDYEDYVNLLSQRYSPHLQHYVVWNEVASAGWMDCSPQTPNRAGPGGSNTLTEEQFDYWVTKYARAAARHLSSEPASPPPLLPHVCARVLA
jgi:hypothetical protein